MKQDDRLATVLFPRTNNDKEAYWNDDNKVFFLEKYYFSEEFCNFSKFWRYLIFWQKIINKVGKTFPNKNSWNAFYSKKANLTDFQKIQVFYKNKNKNFIRALKTAFYMSRGIFWGKCDFLKKKFFRKSFSDFERKVSGNLTKKFRKGCQKCILRVQLNILAFYKNFSQRERNWSTSGQRIGV